MPSDYGDEAGGRLLDWMMRIGQEAGGAAMARSAEGLMDAIRNSRAALDDAGNEPDGGNAPRYAKLDLSEFQTLPEYEDVKRAISEALESGSIEHGFASGRDADFLVFRVEDAPEVDESLGLVEAAVGRASERTELKGLQGEAPEAERLSEKAEAARDAAQAYNSARDHGRELERAMQRSR